MLGKRGLHHTAEVLHVLGHPGSAAGSGREGRRGDGQFSSSVSHLEDVCQLFLNGRENGHTVHSVVGNMSFNAKQKAPLIPDVPFPCYPSSPPVAVTGHPALLVSLRRNISLHICIVIIIIFSLFSTFYKSCYFTHIKLYSSAQYASQPNFYFNNSLKGNSPGEAEALNLRPE